MYKMRKDRKNFDWGAMIILAMALIFYLGLGLIQFFSHYYTKGLAAIIDGFLVFFLFSLISAFLYFGSKFITKDQNKWDKGDEKKEKGFGLKMIFDKKGKYFKNLFLTSFHLIPFYLPFVIFKSDIDPAYKFILFGLSIISYLLFEFYYAIKKIIVFIKKFNQKFVKNWLLALFNFVFGIAFFFIAASYVAISMMIFYANRFLNANLSMFDFFK